MCRKYLTQWSFSKNACEDQNLSSSLNASVVFNRFKRYLRLGQLVVVMGESQIKPPTVDVHGLSQDSAGHGRTLDVPTGPPLKQRSQEESG